MKEMKILKQAINVKDDLLDIEELKFLKENPRVYAVTYGKPDFENLLEEQQQKFIYEKLSDEPSVKKLRPDIKRHGGLIEPILVRMDTMEVIEGNSRLAVYHKLNKEHPGQDWGFIHCDTVESLTDDQQAAYLNEIHVKGKTPWLAYAKANNAYLIYEKGKDIEYIAELLGETRLEIQKRIDIITMIKENNDFNHRHFSYYDVVVRNRKISKAIKEEKLPYLLSDIRNLGSDEARNDFTALEMRNKLPEILGRSKILKKYNEKDIDLDEAYQRAKISNIEENVRKATNLLSDVSKEKVNALDKPRLDALKQNVKTLLEHQIGLKK